MTARRASFATLGLGANLFLSCCGVSSTVAISPSKPKAIFGRAVLVFSVAVESTSPYQGFGVQLDQYDLRKQEITGGCFWFERVTGEVKPPTPGAKKYFAFLVPPGAYA